MNRILGLVIGFCILAFNIHAQCNGKPFGGYVRTGNDICLNDTLLCTLDSATSGTGITYQWQFSPNDQANSFVDMPGVTGTTYKSLVTTSYQYFRVIVTCTNGANVWKDTSASAQVVYINILPWNEKLENMLVIGRDRVWNCWRNYCTTGEFWSSQAGRGGQGSVCYNFQGGPKPPYPVNQSHNNLLVTPAFELQGGISYRFSFFHKEDGANICWDSMYVTWGRSNRKDSMTNRFGRVLTKFSFDEFVRFQEDFTAPTTGIYYFGIVVKDVDVNKGDMIFDDFQLKPITACNLASDIKKGRAQTVPSIKRIDVGQKDLTGNQQYCIGDTIVISYDPPDYNDYATPIYPNPNAAAPYLDYSHMTYQIEALYIDSDYRRYDTFQRTRIYVPKINPSTGIFYKDYVFYTKSTRMSPTYSAVVDSIWSNANNTTVETLVNKFRNLPPDNNCHITNITDYHAVNIVATDTNTFYRIVATCQLDGKTYASDSVKVNGTKAVPWCTRWEEVGNIAPPQQPIRWKTGGAWNSHQSCPKCWLGLPESNFNGKTGLQLPADTPFVPGFRTNGNFVFMPKGNVRRHLIAAPARLYKGRGYRFSFYYADNNSDQYQRRNTDSLYVALGRTANAFLANQGDAYNTNPPYTQNRFQRVSHVRLNFSANVLETGIAKYQQFWFDYMPPDTATYYFAIFAYGANAGNNAMLLLDGFCLDTLPVAGCNDTPVGQRIRISPGDKTQPYLTPDNRWCSGAKISVEMCDPPGGTTTTWKYGNKIQWQYQIVGQTIWYDMLGDTSTFFEYTLTNQNKLFRVKLTNPCGVVVYSDTINIQAPGSVLPYRETFESLGTTTGDFIVPQCWYIFPRDNWSTSSNNDLFGGKSMCGGTNFLYTQRRSPNKSVTFQPTQMTAVAPGFFLETDSTYRFSFWYKDNGSSTLWDSLYSVFGLSPLNVNTPMQPSFANFKNEKYRYYTAEIKAATTADHFFGIRVKETSALSKRQYVDNVEFKKKYQHDLVVVSLDSPFTKCGMNSAMTIVMSVMNLGTDTLSNIPIGYSVNGGASVSNTYSGTIAPGEVKQVAFSTTADLSIPKVYDFTVWTALPSDQDKWDDTFSTCSTVEHRLDPPVPSFAVDTICLGTSPLIVASTPVNGDNTLWFLKDTSKSPFFVGDQYRILNLERDTVLWVQSSTGFKINIPPYYSTLGGQQSTNNGNGLVFDVYKDKCDSVIIESVDMYPTAPGSIVTFRLERNDGSIMKTYTGVLPFAGRNQVQVDWTVGPGTDYRIRLISTSTGMTWNSDGAFYPYPTQANGMVSITGPTNPGPGLVENYNYFYNWKLACKGCESSRVPININTKASPKIDLGQDTIVCSYPKYFLKPNPALNYTSYTWNTGANTSTLHANVIGKYRYALTVTNNIGCYGYDSVEVTVGQSPIFNINDTAGCEGGIVPLETKVMQLSSYIYAWNSGQITPNINVTQSGRYQVTAYDIFNFCYQDDTSIVTMNPNPIVNLGKDGIFCGNPYLLDGTTKSGGAHDYLWDDASTSAQRVITADGKVNVMVTSQATKCFTRDTLDMLLRDKPNVNLGNDTSVCGLNLILKAPAGLSYTWSTTQIAPTINVTTDNTYWLEVRDTTTNCKNRDSIQVSFKKVPFFDLGPDIVQCGGTVPLTAPSGLTWNWETPLGTATSQSVTASNSGTYKITVDNNCYNFIDSIKIAIESKPVIDLLPSTIASCGNVQVTAASDPQGMDITWTGDKKGNSLIIDKTGSYSVAMKNSCGIVNKTIQARIDSQAKADFYINYPGIPMSIGLIDASEGAADYLWDFGDGNNSRDQNPSHTYTRDGVFAVTLTVKNACGSKSVTKYTIKMFQQFLGIKDNISNTGIKLYPNPTSSQLTYEVSGLREGQYRIELRDVQGRNIYSDKVETQNGAIKKQMDVTQYSKGTYRIVLIDSQNKKIERAIVIE